MSQIRFKRAPKKQHAGRTSCAVPGCGRPINAGGYCQTHVRHLTLYGRTLPIRPYRERRQTGTVPIAGLRLTEDCAHELRRLAATRGLSLGASIADILEAWHRAKLRRRRG